MINLNRIYGLEMHFLTLILCKLVMQCIQRIRLNPNNKCKPEQRCRNVKDRSVDYALRRAEDSESGLERKEGESNQLPSNLIFLRPSSEVVPEKGAGAAGALKYCIQKKLARREESRCGAFPVSVAESARAPCYMHPVSFGLRTAPHWIK